MIGIADHRNNNRMPLITFFLFYVANLIRMMDISPYPYIVMIIMAGLIGWWWFFQLSCRKTYVLLVFFIMFVSGIFNCLLIDNIDIGELINIICFFGILFCYFSSKISVKTSTILMMTCLGLFVVHWIKDPLEPHIFSSSRNYNSIIMIVFACIYYTSLENNNKQIQIWPAIIIFLLSVWSMGRGGILSTAILLFGLIILRYRRILNRFKYYRYVNFIVLIIFIFAILLYDVNVGHILENTFFQLGKFSYEGGDSERSILWNEYFENASNSSLHFLMGAPLDQCFNIHSFENNTHNSFIQLHAYNGLLSVIVILILIIRAELHFIKKRLGVHFLLMNVLILRSMTDKFIFFQYGFPVFMYFIFYKDFISCSKLILKKPNLYV